MAVSIFALAACSSSGNSGGGSSGSSAPAGISSGGSAAPTGTSINVMTIYPDNNTVLNLPEIKAGAEAYATYINAHGGINGHPLKVTTCNEHNDVTAAQQCARQAVSSHAVAVIGSVSTFTGQIVPILEKAGITWLNGNGGSPLEFTSPVSYLLGGGPLALFAGNYSAAKKMGCKSYGMVTFDVAAAVGLVPFIQQGVTKAGVKFGSVVKIPPTSTDYSSAVTAGEKDDCMAVILPGAAVEAYLAKAKALGVQQKFWLPQAAFTNDLVKNFGAQLEGAYTASPFAGLDNPVWAPAKQVAAGVITEPQAQIAWSSYAVFNAVAKKMSGDITATTFKAAMDRATDVETDGMYPPLDLGKPFPVPSFARIVDTKFVDLKFQGGKLVQDGTFVDYEPIFASK